MSGDNAAGAPDWDLLPDDPQGFFGLEPGFDRKTLKRAYTRWIKVFKPERHPEQFQAIRAAYEVLDARLRFGIENEPSIRFPAEQGAAWELQAPSGGRSDARPYRTGAEERSLLVETVRERGAETARDELRAALDRGESEWTGAWTALALLEDELANDAKDAFLGVLVEGYTKSRGAPECHSLLMRVLREDLAPKKAAALLRDLAKGTGPTGAPPSTYWFLTEYQWTQLVRSVSFESFDRLLKACASEVGEAGHGGLVVLLAKLRRVAMFRADEDWIARVDREFEDSARMLPPWVESDIDLAQWLTGYRTVRPAFVDGSVIRDVIDRAIVSAIEADEVDADRAFLEAQLMAIDRPDEWMESLRAGAAASDAVLGYLMWYGHDWRERRGIDEDEDSRTARTRALEFSRRLDRRSGRTWISRVWNYSLFFWMIAIVLVIGAISELFESALGEWTTALPVTALIVLAVGFLRGWWWRPIEVYSRPFARRQHRRVWRPMAAGFLAETRTPFHVLVDVLGDPKAPTGYFELHAIANDIGLASYAEALRNVAE